MRNLTVRGTRMDVLGLIQYLKSEPLEPGETARQREKLLADLGEAHASPATEGKRYRVRCARRAPKPRSRAA